MAEFADVPGTGIVSFIKDGVFKIKIANDHSNRSQ